MLVCSHFCQRFLPPSFQSSPPDGAGTEPAGTRVPQVPKGTEVNLLPRVALATGAHRVPGSLRRRGRCPLCQAPTSSRPSLHASATGVLVLYLHHFVFSPFRLECVMVSLR